MSPLFLVCVEHWGSFTHLEVKCLLFSQGSETNVPTYFLSVLNNETGRFDDAQVPHSHLSQYVDCLIWFTSTESEIKIDEKHFYTHAENNLSQNNPIALCNRKYAKIFIMTKTATPSF